jgi:hypothetical protein
VNIYIHEKISSSEVEEIKKKWVVMSEDKIHCDVMVVCSDEFFSTSYVPLPQQHTSAICCFFGTI